MTPSWHTSTWGVGALALAATDHLSTSKLDLHIRLFLVLHHAGERAMGLDRTHTQWITPFGSACRPHIARLRRHPHGSNVHEHRSWISCSSASKTLVWIRDHKDVPAAASRIERVVILSCGMAAFRCSPPRVECRSRIEIHGAKLSNGHC